MKQNNIGKISRKYAKWEKEGRGKGELSNYRPWLDNRSFPTVGNMHRIHGIKTNRRHELFSDSEANYFYILDLASNILDIQEQFPLFPLAETISISEHLGIKHPYDSPSKDFYVITTDFLITVLDGTRIARTIKPSEELENIKHRDRILEKFELQRIYWKLRKIDWGIITDLDINPILVSNCKKIHRFYYLNGYKVSEFDLPKMYDFLTTRILEEKETLNESAKKCDIHFGFRKNSSINIIFHFIARQYWSIDLYTLLDTNNVFHLIDYSKNCDFSKSYNPQGIDKLIEK